MDSFAATPAMNRVVACEGGERTALEARRMPGPGPGEMLSKMVRWIDRTTRCLPAGSLASIRSAVDIVGRA